MDSSTAERPPGPPPLLQSTPCANIVGVTKNGRPVLAATSLNVFGQERIPTDNCKATKVRQVGDALMAITGWSLYDNIMEDLLASRETPPLRDEKEIFTFFMELWKELHERYPFVNDQPHETDSPFGDCASSFMVANAAGSSKFSQDRRF